MAINTPYGQGTVITMQDEWRLTTDFSGTGVIAANWERNDYYYSKTGDGMSESSGVFTFPTTGLYEITYFMVGTRSESEFFGAHLYETHNNSTYYTLSYARDSNSDATSTTWCQAIGRVGIDITDTSNQKVKLVADTYGTFSIKGNSSYTATGMSFIRLGDT